VRFTIDSNILVYAIDVATPDKHDRARDLLVRAGKCDAVLTVQALAEFLAVIRRKYPQHIESAAAQADRWCSLFPPIPTNWAHVSAAARFSRIHGLQLWDCIIWQAARSAGASVFLSEDMQDGLSIEGMTVMNPLLPANAGRLAELLERAGDVS
jgi:predicted nucleic acid-binding protein